MDIIKLKINLPNNVYKTLLSDMKSFNFVKKDGSVNKNEFINCLINNFFNFFNQREKIISKRLELLKSFSEEDYPVVSSLLNEGYLQKKENLEKDLQFIIQKRTLGVYETIIYSKLKNRCVSQYLREMFVLYSSFDQPVREKLLHSDIVSKLDSSIDASSKSLIILDEENVLINPYKLVTPDDGLFNYLIGIKESGEKREVVSIVLSKIKNVILDGNKAEFTAEEKIKMDLSIKQCAIFPINEIVDMHVILSERGTELFESCTLNRPTPYEISGNIFKFKGSLSHLVTYFFKFGNEARVISPQFAIDFIKEKFNVSLKNYERK